MRNASKKDIMRFVRISQIANYHKIEMIESISGNFTHKCKCPAPNHKSGLEKTESLYIDSKNNNFYCFGCSASNNVIDFHMLCTGDTFSEAMQSLSKLVDRSVSPSSSFLINTNTFSTLMKMSKLIRDTRSEHLEDFEWIDKVMKKLDRRLLTISRTDVESAELIFDDLKKAFGRRYK